MVVEAESGGDGGALAPSHESRGLTNDGKRSMGSRYCSLLRQLTPWLISSMVHIANKVRNEGTTLPKTTKPTKY